MAKDLIIGGAANYTYDQVKYWINSIKKSGFSGDIVLAVTNMKNDDLVKIAAKGVQILAYGQKDADGNYVNNSNTPPHVERFFYIWNFLNQCEDYRFVITTDVRDVVFQSDPSIYLEQALMDGQYGSLLAAGEGLRYQDEPWGQRNYTEAFGPFFYNLIREKEIYNVGIIAGEHHRVKDLLLMIMQLSLGRPIKICDQAVYNFILDVQTFGNDVMFMKADDHWATNLGTSIHAIRAGAGDIGQNNSISAQILYESKYLAQQPIITDGVVKTQAAPLFWMRQMEGSEQTENPYVIVHQYDRVPELKQQIERLYGDE